MTTLLKFALACLSLLTLTHPATAESVRAPGEIFYRATDGDLISRDVTLIVPARGEGEVILESQRGQVTASSFRTQRERGRTIFIVNFDNPPGTREGTQVTFIGTYIRGGGEARYYGDVYGAGQLEQSQFSTLPIPILKQQWQHLGGFQFAVQGAWQPRQSQQNSPQQSP